MRIKLTEIKDSGVLEKERFVFKVLQSGNLGIYMVATSKEIAENTFSSDVKNLYWLPDQEIKEGDLVVLYTKKGKKNSTVNKDGSTTYFYYWGLTESLSIVEKKCVILFESTWRVIYTAKGKEENNDTL